MKKICRVIGPLWGESTDHRWIPLTKASDAELGCFRWSAPEQTFEQTIETPVIGDTIALIMTLIAWAKDPFDIPDLAIRYVRTIWHKNNIKKIYKLQMKPTELRSGIF